MFEYRLKDLIQNVYCGRTLVLANYTASQTLFTKGLSPAIFLHNFYAKKYPQNRVFYFIKQKGFRELCDVLPIDIKQYEAYRDEKVNKLLKETVLATDKQVKHITKETLLNREQCEVYLRTLHYYWFEKASQILLYASTIDSREVRVSTLDQPIGLNFLIEVEDPAKAVEDYKKLKSSADERMRKMFGINPTRIRNLPLLVILLFDSGKGTTYQTAQACYERLKKDFNLDVTLLCTIELNSAYSKPSTQWSKYPRPIIHQEYRLEESMEIQLIGEKEEAALQQYINTHRQKIRLYLEQRLQHLSRRYQENNTAKNKFLNFFRGTPTNERSYNAQQAQTREIADLMFLLGDYKRATDLYKNLVQKFKASERDPAIFYSLSQMIQLSKALGCFLADTPKSKVYYSIENYASKDMMRRASTLGKQKLHRYMVYLVFFMHGFKVFNPEFVRQVFYYYVKKTVNEESIHENNPNPSVIPTLVQQQFANMHILFPVPQHRRYCYQMVRVASKFNQYRLYGHYVRCMSIAHCIYQGSFSFILKYINLGFCRGYNSLGQSRQALQHFKQVWNIMLDGLEEGTSHQEEESEFYKLATHYQKIVNQIERVNPQQLEREDEFCVPVPQVSNLWAQLQDEAIEVQTSGWAETGEVFLQLPELTSKGMNKQNFVKMMRLFDSATPEEKEISFRVKNVNFTPGMNQGMLKRHLRNSYCGQPIFFSFDMKNNLPHRIEISDIQLHLKNHRKCCITLKISQEQHIIKPHHTQHVTFEVVPQEPGIYEFSHISWQFLKMKSIFRVKEPWESQSQEKNVFGKLNVLEETGRLRAQLKHSHQHYEGEITEVEFVLINEGSQKIEEAYVAVDNSKFFCFRWRRYEIGLQPGQSKTITLGVRIPLFERSHQSNYWKLPTKAIILYRCQSGFRVVRASSIFNIVRVADIHNIVCQRISKTLHFLQFMVKWNSAQQMHTQMLKSMIVEGGYEIKKEETNSFGPTTTQYFFFMRRNQETPESLAQFQFASHSLNTQQVFMEHLKKREEGATVGEGLRNQLRVCFIWSDLLGKCGIIDPKPIDITSVESSSSKVKLPFSVRVLLKDDHEWDFSEEPVLEVEVELVIRNIFDPKEIRLIVELTDNVSNDFYWQGVTQHQIQIKYGEEKRFKVKLLAMRGGIYNIANNIKYIIAVTKASSYSVSHREYQNIYMTVQEPTHTPKTAFDFFEDIKEGAFKKKEESKQEAIAKEEVELI